MARFNELSEYKFTIISRLLENEELSKAIYYNDTDFLGKPNVNDPTEKLVYNHIFPYRFIPDVNESKQTFITLSFRKFRLVNNHFKTGLIYVNVFTHRDLFKTDYGCTRIDFLTNKVDELLNQKRGIGIGQLEFVDMDEIVVNDKYQGNYICYKPVDFN
ncbi:hypothetical protein [Paenibacillus elgii]|uniref:hypothetical protein n=1 Tax=Paenibacillus elgii TaxID=189691 RepID=UPI002042157B|nr:hypothetical protein [Paenibacillus elgii]MCM3273903.1 hypothetical protein [Paenibacillus elgii]